MKKYSLLALALAAISGLATQASADSITYLVSSTNTGQPVAALADFAFNTNYLTITLTNLTYNPVSAASLLGGIEFEITGSGAGHTPTLSDSLTIGNLITVNSNKTWTDIADNATDLAKWNFDGATNTLRPSGPTPMIIGNPDMATNKYLAANNSLAGNNPHNPLIKEWAKFTLMFDTNVTHSSVKEVNFLFGTTFTEFEGFTTGAPPSPVPLPAAVWSGLSLLGVCGLAAKLRTRRRTIA